MNGILLYTEAAIILAWAAWPLNGVRFFACCFSLLFAFIAGGMI